VNEQLQSLREEIEGLRREQARLNRRLRLACSIALASLVVALFASPTSRAVAQSGYGATLQALIDKTQYITVAGGEMYIRGTNLHIENGLGATNGNPDNPVGRVNTATNGKGNLILGYNSSRVPDGGTDLRTGSHNLVLGDRNNYSSYGGIVAGSLNTITAPYASVASGAGNTASGDSACVSGGLFGIASGPYASVSGGNQNKASEYYASVSGGSNNTASGTYAWVSGGQGNQATGDYASVSGGYANSAGGLYASVSGGRRVTQANSFGWAAGGDYFPGIGPGIFHAP
jgi:hypothetical protein